MFVPIIPEHIENAFQLRSFIKYTVNGILNDVNSQIKYNGCKLTSTSYREVEVDIYLVIPEDECWTLNHILQPQLTRILDKLAYKSWYFKKITPIPICNSFKIEKEEKSMYIPEVKEIIHRKSERGEIFTVVWNDETKTSVKLQEGDESDEYVAYLYALGKKMFANKGTARAFIREKKKVFEDRVAKISDMKKVQRRNMALEQSLNAKDVGDISERVYEEMFVPAGMISRSVFRRNRS